MIQLWCMNDQAEAALPELKRCRADLVDRTIALTDKQAAEQTRLTRALVVIAGLIGQIEQHQASLRRAS